MLPYTVVFLIPILRVYIDVCLRSPLSLSLSLCFRYVKCGLFTQHTHERSRREGGGVTESYIDQDHECEREREKGREGERLERVGSMGVVAFIRHALLGDATTVVGAVRPFAVNAVISSATMVTGDAICQRIQLVEAKDDEETTTSVANRSSSSWKTGDVVLVNDMDRAVRFATVGATLKAPFMLIGFRCIDRVFGPAVTLRTATTKMISGHVTMMPSYLVLFFYYMGWLDGLTHEQRIEKIQKGFVPAAITHTCFWPFANMINFLYVKPNHRVAYVGVVGVMWSTLLSYVERVTAPSRGRRVQEH